MCEKALPMLERNPTVLVPSAGCYRVGAIRVVEGLEGRNPCESKGTEAGEDDEGKVLPIIH